ncbi:2-C-methyl-D-erythritol 4-phosphate cytidylyltransferase [Nocardioides sp. BP30]|uniref:IspD/TarI family cytidylyltransferase n=1 Tax=Nocardioides sp. BP30 TaxID=3036374 RepID=UPI0024696457|nr:2-C-methyl-D-erythritol 4-phosphate cytidylyltransferase [Nocardioides sp. BP30]WGL53102.1 2-C-methyl-D-erythritol 4-phosphate cytidylyltransferase [Nocardioides sp. BP30]
MPAAIVLLAAGSGSRVGAGMNKVLLPLGGSTVLGRSLATALTVPEVARVVLVVRSGEEPQVAEAVVGLLGEREVLVVAGGQTRHASEWQALRVLAPDIESGAVDVVAIHDSARPLAGADLYHATITAAREYGGAIPTAPLGHLLTRALEPVAGDADGHRLVGVQTPQSFRAPELLAAYSAAAADGAEFTDTAGCLERYGRMAIVAVPSTRGNLKVTFPEDVALAEALG